MAFNSQAGSSSQAFQTPPFAQYGSPSRSQQQSSIPPFDVLEWYPKFQSCLRFFLDHAQHDEVHAAAEEAGDSIEEGYEEATQQ